MLARLVNICFCRPKATQILQQFVTLYKEEGENYIDIVDFTNKARIQTSLMNPASNLDIMNRHRIDKFKVECCITSVMTITSYNLIVEISYNNIMIQFYYNRMEIQLSWKFLDLTGSQRSS